MNETPPSMSLTETVVGRRSWVGFGNGRITVGEIIEIAHLARMTPSEQNLQPWRLVVAQGAALQRVLPTLLGANAVKAQEAGTVVVFVGDHGVIDESPVAAAFYTTRSRRDFALRNTALFLMTFMLIAHGSGFVSRPLAGFDEASLGTACDLRENECPVAALLLAPAPSNDHPQARPERKPATSFVRVLS